MKRDALRSLPANSTNMPSAATPRRKQREVKQPQYFSPGRKGRKTGVELKDTGIRDENFIEPLPSDLFSAEKTTASRRNVAEEDTTATSEDMDVAQSPAPEPQEYTGRLNRAAVKLPPPGRSPFKKTAIGASPQRANSIRKSLPRRGQAATATERPDPSRIARKLDFSGDGSDVVASIERIPSRDSRAFVTTRQTASPVSSIPLEGAEPADDGNSMLDYNNDDDFVADNDESLVLIPDEASLQTPVPLPKSSSKSRQLSSSATRSRGKKRKSDQMADESNAGYDFESNIDPALLNDYSAAPIDVSMPLPDTGISLQQPESGQTEASVDGARAQRSSKQSTKRRKGPAPKAVKVTKTRSSPKRPAPRAKTQDGSDDEGRADSAAPTFKRPAPRSLTLLRQGTPGEDEGARVTRSGRVSHTPLQYWKNEGYIWRNGEIEGIVRAEEVNAPKQAKKGGRKKAAPLRKIAEVDEEEDEDMEEWEHEPGRVVTYVRTWDQSTGVPADQEHEEEVAYASTSIETREVTNADFRYAKIMTLPFFGTGLVELPPQGFKTSKPTRKWQMIFFVHQGRVTVEVAGSKFGIGKGGVWQVPRGNHYSIRNESTTQPAKVFFAQACHTLEAEMI